MQSCTEINLDLWIGNSFPGVFSLPNLVNLSSLYIGDALYDDPTQTIASGTLTRVLFPALEKVYDITAVNLDSLAQIDVPKLSYVYNDITLSGLPALTNFTVSPSYVGWSINITNTGISEFNYQGDGDIYKIMLTSNPNLAKVTIGENVGVDTLTIDCSGLVSSQSYGTFSSYLAAVYPLPQFDGPKNISDLDVGFCLPPTGDWKTAFAGVGSVESQSMTFHDNKFSSLSVPDLKNCTGTIEIDMNSNLTNVTFPALKYAGALQITDNDQLKYLNASAFPLLNTINYTSKLDGSFEK